MIEMKANFLRTTKWAILLIGLAVVFAGCQSTVKDTSSGNKVAEKHSDPGMHDMKAPPPQANVDATGKNEVEIVIENFTFSPSDVTIAPGTKVTWVNKDEAPHTATSTSPDKKFNSGGLDTDDKFSFVFNDKGDYPYFCSLHPQMKATIKVK
jgi:plastocyanin